MRRLKRINPAFVVIVVVALVVLWLDASDLARLRAVLLDGPGRLAAAARCCSASARSCCAARSAAGRRSTTCAAACARRRGCIAFPVAAFLAVRLRRVAERAARPARDRQAHDLRVDPRAARGRQGPARAARGRRAERVERVQLADRDAHELPHRQHRATASPGPRCARRRASFASSRRRARASSSSTPSRPRARCARSTPS